MIGHGKGKARIKNSRKSRMHLYQNSDPLLYKFVEFLYLVQQISFFLLLTLDFRVKSGLVFCSILHISLV